jgi:hypothetical protein
VRRSLLAVPLLCLALVPIAGGATLSGDAGRDVLRITCGSGRDIVVADAFDLVAGDCEIGSAPEPEAPAPGQHPTPAPIQPEPPAPAPAPRPGSTRENPIPLGQTAAISGGWQMRVLSSIPDATAQVLAENQFNDPPAAGRQFFIARVEATYTGPGSSTFSAGFRLSAVGPSGFVHRTFDEDGCGVIPDDFPFNAVFTGGVLTGNVCWSVSATDAAGLVILDDDFGSEDTFFAST